MSVYNILDALILGRLEAQPFFLLNIDRSSVRQECKRLEKELGRDAFRILDARLQALRRAGKIAFDSKTGWRLT